MVQWLPIRRCRYGVPAIVQSSRIGTAKDNPRILWRRQQGHRDLGAGMQTGSAAADLQTLLERIIGRSINQRRHCLLQGQVPFGLTYKPGQSDRFPYLLHAVC